jgi:hypothetical protein
MKGLKGYDLWFPNPGGMHREAQTQLVKDFFRFLDDWHYGRLSQDSHLSYMGLVRRGGVLSDEHLGENQERYRSQVSLTALTLYVALLSEVIIHAGLPFEKRRIRNVWEYIDAYPGAAELWKERYEAVL